MSSLLDILSASWLDSISNCPLDFSSCAKCAAVFIASDFERASADATKPAKAKIATAAIIKFLMAVSKKQCRVSATVPFGNGKSHGFVPARERRFRP